MEFDAAGSFHIHAQGLCQMPGDGFAFPVRVGCEIDLGSGLGFLADLGEDLAPAMDGDIFHFKIVFRIHAQLGLGQIAHMALRSLYLVAPAQKFCNGAGLGGRFHDNQFG